VFDDLRDPKLGGRCGACEFAKLCGGCRCRAYATYGDYLAEDPACGYQPGAHGGRLIDLPASLTFGLPPTINWSGRRTRASDCTRFPRSRAAWWSRPWRPYARGRGETVITKELLADVAREVGRPLPAVAP